MLIAPRPVQADLGTVLADYHVGATEFVLDPTRPRLYATIPNTNSVMVIDTNTLAVVATIPVGTSPAGLAVTPDGSHLYVANSASTSSAISVVDLSTLNVVSTLPAPFAPWEIEVGNNNRLYVSSANQATLGIMQIDGNTGNLLGYLDPDRQVSYYYRTALQISPDRQSLFVANRGISPATLAKFDISTTIGVQLDITHSNIGGNGEDLVISHNGLFISDVVGGGNTLYDIRMIPTGDLSGNLGSFATGPYPNGLAYSPDDRLAFTNNDAAQIQIFSTSTGALVGSFSMPFAPNFGTLQMMVDATGTHLFASFIDSFGSNPSQFEVFDISQTIPEPASGLLLCGGMAVLGWRRQR